MGCSNLSQHPNVSWQTDTERGPGATDRLHASSQDECVHSLLRSRAGIKAEACAGRVTEPSGAFDPMDRPTLVRLSCHLQDIPRSRKEAPHSLTHSLNPCTNICGVHPMIKSFRQRKRTLPCSLLVIGFSISQCAGGEEDAIKANSLKLIVCFSPG